MRLLVLILSRVQVLEELLGELVKANIRGATILNSTGMVQALSSSGNNSFLRSLRSITDPDRQDNKVVLIVFREDQVETAVQVIEREVGDLDQPDTGIVFTLPIDFIRGIPTA